ncbi:MAG: TolC family protein [Bacteroidia bacterium]|nr:TolC family protein [Bacteroidia bacterium]MDW8236382.1 TolC family protein [Bacteroidia bacterium]
MKLRWLGLWYLTWGQILPSFPPAKAQWISLPEFLQAVRQNALVVRQSATALRPAQMDAFQASANFLPSLSASATATQNYGTTFDPFAFQRIQRTTTFSSFSLSANWVLFAGLANHYLLRQAKAGIAAAQSAYRRTEAEVLTQALLQFSQVLSDSITLTLSLQRLSRLQTQIQRSRALVLAGQALPLDTLSLSAQIAREEAQYLALYNRHRENKLALLQLMGRENLSPDEVEFHLGLTIPDLPPLSEEEAIRQALQFAPELEEARWRLLQQQYAVRLSRAGHFPTLSLSASIQTNYSSNAGRIIGFNPNTQSFITERIPFSDQLRENLNQSVFLSLSVPIFRQFRQVQQRVRAEAALESAEYQALLQKQQVIRRTEQAYLAWRNALQQEQALQRSMEAARLAYLQAQQQYEAGRLSYWNYQEALLSFSQAELELQQARLEKALRILLLNAYLGKYSDL